MIVVQVAKLEAFALPVVLVHSSYSQLQAITAMADSRKVYYLQMLAAKPHLHREFVDPAAALQQVVPADARINQRYYREVGDCWLWHDKRDWPLSRWQNYIDGFGEGPQPASAILESIVTATLARAGEELGYYELGKRGQEVEIRYFGLLPQAIGRGFGAPLLSAAIAHGWRLGAQRLWVHTCADDHPAALYNYQQRGFELYQTVEESIT